MYGSVEGQ